MGLPEVIYEDQYLLAINKPSGWVVNESLSASDDLTLQKWVCENLRFDISCSKDLRSGIVHRLDKPTSGVVLVAKNEQIFNALQKEFADRRVHKTYLALVHGSFDQASGEINEPVGRLPWKRTKFGVISGGRSAVTGYKVIKKIEGYSLLELYPKTGRTHQIRVHLKHVGHPIVSDPLYAGRKTLREDLKKFPRLWLHAKSIEFGHPVTKARLRIEAPLPPDLKLS
jgi:23S rRNA pseudouridine1911/1915/1917 synthase